jgi:branched-chain amino acid transport system permease protein
MDNPAPITPDKNGWRRWLMLAVIMAALIALPFVAKAAGNPALTTLVTRIIILAIAAASLNLLLGFGGLVSFGHAAYYGLGAYAVGILAQAFVDDTRIFGLFPGTDQLLISLPVAMVVSGLAALLLGSLSLRTRGVQFIMITLAFAQMVFFLFAALKVYGGTDGLLIRRRNVLPMLNTRDDITFYFLCLGLACLWLLLLARIVRSRFGAVLDGLRQNEKRMAAIGVPSYPYQLAAFVIAGIGAGLAGALMANFLRFASPDMLHWSQSGEFLIMVVLGGAGTLLGPVAGAALLIGLETLLAAWTEHWQFGLGLLLILIILFARNHIQRWSALIGGGRA